MKKVFGIPVVIAVFSVLSQGEGDCTAIEQSDLFIAGEGGYHTYRIPAIVVTMDGDVLTFCEGRKNGPSDSGKIDLLLRRSRDGGTSWSEPLVVHAENGAAPVTIGNPCPIVDRQTGTIHLLFCRNNRWLLYCCSNDGGLTWSLPKRIGAALRGFDFPWTRCGIGPGHGIQLEAGPRVGRLIAPIWVNERIGVNYRAGVVYSDDGGESWSAGGLVGSTIPDTNECMAVEVGETVLLNMRVKGGKKRSVTVSADGGESWTEPQWDETLIGPTCQASLLRLRQSKGILFANPASLVRERLTVRHSGDGCRTWTHARPLYEGPSGYSDLGELPDGTILCLYERGRENYRQRITLARFTLQWLSSTAKSDRIPN